MPLTLGGIVCFRIQWVLFILPAEEMVVLETNSCFMFNTAGRTGGFFSLYDTKLLRDFT